MSRIPFSMLFFVRKTKTSDSKGLSLYARITQKGKRADFSLNKNVNPEDWDPDGGGVLLGTKESKELNSFIEKTRQKINKIKADLEDRNKDVSPEIIRDIYLGQDKEQKGLLQLFDEHNEKAEKLVNIDFAEGTIERYKTCRKHVAEFMQHKYRKDEILLKDVNHQFIADFEFYLKTEKTCCNNTTVKYIKNFKKIIRLAMANDMIKVDPFRNIKFHLDEVDMAYLTDEELNKIMEKNYVSERMRVVRDIYIFCCFTGLAFSDVSSLCPADLFQESDGSWWIKKKRRKTKNWCHIPIMHAAWEILTKYKDDRYCNEKNVCLPVLTNQKMNSYLKEIADVNGINKELSTHTARHTFATTVTLKNKVSIEVVSKMLGHSSINMTKKYARVVDELIKTDMSKIMDKYTLAPMMAN